MLAWAGCGLFFSFFIFHFSFSSVYAEVISSPRFARGDVTGDGIAEVIAGGRVGPFRGVDAPPQAQRARIAVYRMAGSLLELLGEGPELHVVEDVAAGDLDGDGHDEVLAVGAGRLVVLGWAGNALHIRRIVNLEGLWTDRVVAGDLDGDGRTEVGVTVYDVDADADVGKTAVVFYDWEANGPVLNARFEVPLHVGDMCLADLDASGRLELVLEAGTGDEGGEARVYRAPGGTFREVWRGPVTENRLRATHLSAVPGRFGVLAAGSPGGQIQFYRLEGNRLTYQRTEDVRGGLTGLLLVQDGRRVDMLVGIRSSGAAPPVLRKAVLSF